MQVEVDRKGLERVLRLARFAEKGVDGRPYAHHLRVEATGEFLEVQTAAGLPLSMQATIPAAGDDSGAAAVPVRVLGGVVGVLDAETVTLRAKSDTVTVAGGRSTFQVRGLPVADFPALGAVPTATGQIPAAVLLRLIAMTEFSVCRNDFHANAPHGAQLVIGGGRARMVSTDGHRLSVAELPLGVLFDDPGSIIIPAGAFPTLKALAAEAEGDLFLRIDAKRERLHVRALFPGGGWALITTETGKEAFPLYQQVIPAASPYTFELSRTAAWEALRRVAVVAQDATVAMQGRGAQVVLTAHKQDVGAAEEVLDVIGGGVPEGEIGVNGRFLTEALHAMEGDRVIVACGGVLDPVVLRSADGAYLGVIMPVRL